MVEEDNRIVAMGGNVWMNARKIVGLFNITAVSVNRAVKRVLKADVLNDYEVVKLVRLNKGLLMEFYSSGLIIVYCQNKKQHLFNRLRSTGYLTV